MEVPLRRRDGSVRAVALVDDEDAERVLRYRWSWTNGYAVRGMTLAGGKHRTVYLHRELLGLRAGDRRQVDHINRDRLDCRRENLRVCTHAENHQNLAADGNRSGSSRYRGVYLRPDGKWQARVKRDGRHHHVGLFDNEDEAGAAAAAFRAEHMPFALN